MLKHIFNNALKKKTEIELCQQTSEKYIFNYSMNASSYKNEVNSVFFLNFGNVAGFLWIGKNNSVVTKIGKISFCCFANKKLQN